jgi:moderate conductance mechanosensitive channel
VLSNETPAWLVRLDELHLLVPFRIALSLLVAYGLTLLVQRAIRRFVKRTIELPGVDPARAEVRQRALAGALRGALIGVIWTLAVITIIGEMGINIGAFVATATVVGGAVAFGAQQLVRDVIAGIFVLSEDQYGVGDQVDVGHASGVVERITLRSVRLRDGQGGVWHVPHGGVLRVANLTKASMAVLDLEVARSMKLADLDAMAAGLCAALTADPAAAPNLLDAPTALGLMNVTDDRLVYRLMVNTVSGTQDSVRRRWRVLALQAFESGQLDAPSMPAPIVQVNTAAAVEE